MREPSLADTPPPGLVPHAVPGSSSTITLTPAPRPTGQPGRAVGFSISPEWVDWVPVVGLTVALLMTALPWVGSYPGGVRVYTQTPWGALAADVMVNSLPAELLQDEKAIKDRLSTSWWLVAYLPLLILTVVLVWAERFTPTPDRDKVPNGLEFVADYWHLRVALFVGLSFLLLGLLAVQLAAGFGLEAAARRLAAEEAARQVTLDDLSSRDPKPSPGEVEKAVERAVKYGPTLDSRPKQDKYDYLVGRRVGQFVLQGTTALDMAIAAHVLAVLGLLARGWLERRGTKPPPRVEVRY